MKSKEIRQRVIACLMIGMQIVPTISALVFSTVINAAPSSSQAIEPVGAPVTDSQSASAVATSMASNYAADSVEHWLQQFGTAKVQLNVDDNGNWDNSAADLMVPIYNNEHSYAFTQLGLRAPDGRTTGNFGLGVRTFNDKWMYGGNIFFDNDFTGHNQRIGFGAEAWKNYLKFSANTYIGISNWHNSHDFDDYDEKPADGFDLRTEGYLPSLPQLGAKVMFEKYYGSNVALFDKDHLQSNPSAVTVGLNYTPIPLITAGIDYKQGQDSTNETQFTLDFRYSFGQSFKSQISPAEVDGLRQLSGSRYDLVDRNNEIVLQYKKKAQDDAIADIKRVNIKDRSPADGITANEITVEAVTAGRSPVKNAVINWSSSGHAKLSTTTSVTDANGQASVQLTDTSAEQVTVQATSGSVTQRFNTSFVSSVESLDLKITHDGAAADSNEQDEGRVTITDTGHNAMANVPVTWAVDNGAVIVNSDSATDSQGHASVHFSSKKQGKVTLKATAAGKSESVGATFTAQNVANVDLAVARNTIIAGNANVAQATVIDDNKQPIAGTPVQWSITGSATFGSTASNTYTSTTNTDGLSRITFKDTKEETVTLTTTVGEKTDSQTIEFKAGSAAKVVVTMDTTEAVVADGATPVSAHATVTDGKGNPVPDTAVTWSSTGSAVTGTATQTDASGVSTVTLTDIRAETVTLTATVNGQSDAKDATFVPGEPATIVERDGDDTSAIADGIDSLPLQVTVKDSHGNPVANGTEVTWSAIHATPTVSLTGNGGFANGAIISTTPGPDTVTITAGNVHIDVPVSFTAPTFGSLRFPVDMPSSTADGVPVEITVTLVNSSNIPITGATIVWGTVKGHAMAAQETSITDENGVATMNYSSTSIGISTISAVYDGHNSTAVLNTVAP